MIRSFIRLQWILVRFAREWAIWNILLYPYYSEWTSAACIIETMTMILTVLGYVALLICVILGLVIAVVSALIVRTENELKDVPTPKNKRYVYVYIYTL